MNFIESILHRKELNKKYASGLKLTKEEKDWFRINPTFNEKYEFPCYQEDVIMLDENKKYLVTVVLEYSDEKRKIIPLIGVATGKGAITAKTRNEVTGTFEQISTKILGVLISKEHSTSAFSFLAKNGYMSIGYECRYFDPKSRLNKRESSISNLAYGMKKEIVRENQCRYYCKYPLDEKDDFTAMVFTVSWEVS